MNQYANPITPNLSRSVSDFLVPDTSELDIPLTDLDPTPIDKTDAPVQIMPAFVEIPTGGVALRSGGQLPFVAKSVMISNTSGQWWFCPFLDSYVMPYHHFLVINLPHGAMTWEVNPETPAGFVSKQIAGQRIFLTFYDIMQPPSPGVSYAQTAVAQAIT